jgi:hypothetical protein
LFSSLGTLTPVAAEELPQPLQQLSRTYIETAAAADRASLAAYAEKAPQPEFAGLARLALGIGDYFAGEYATAAEILRRAPADASRLGDYALYYRARSLAEAQDFAGAAHLAADFASRYSGSRLIPDALRLRVESLIRADQREAARALLEPEDAPLEEPVRLLLLARVHELDARVREAVETYRRVYYFHPFSDQAAEAESRLNGLRRSMGANYPAAPAAWRLRRGDILFNAGRYAEAWPEYDAAAHGLEGENLDHARVSLGAADYHRLRTTNA